MKVSHLIKAWQRSVSKAGRIWVYLLGIVALSLPSVSMALPCSYSFQVTSVPSLNVDPSVSVGSVIGTASADFRELAYNGCGGSGAGQIVGVGTPNGNVYPTTIPGVGYRGLILSRWTVPLADGYWPTGFTFNAPAWFATGFPAGKLQIEFIKTGTVSPSGGTFGPTPIGYLMVSGMIGATFNLNTSIVIKPVSNTCTITQSVIMLGLDDANTSELTSAGNTSKDKQFNIPVRCNSPANVSLSFNGEVANSANGVFRNLNNSSANANTVGIQILRAGTGTPIPTTAGSYLNLGVINGTTSVPLIARYYALANNPAEGDVRTLINATLIYN